MKFSRNASANWKGSGKEGKGTVSTETTVLDKTPYSFKSRFEDGKGTNPEELLGAAHAGCFSMKLSFVLNEMGYTAENIDTSAKVTMEDGKISNIHLELNAKVPDISSDDFQKAAKDAKENCPVSALFNTEITMDAKLG
ncbi:OsmC family protein [Echinicola vietnamensis]|uniref:Peroxiredoxin, OsmC subfamily n=1 Tax=Echinicola vietnamensis (strain DSM 17526 / LMG 23754 / KMM 6221) TaxID=926556 RepID=L0G2K7_ECHVK|nr:OsmC family protein [Echinicola vietnamensis]AGA79777.1 peroxiredoxin, OsmC subfamily [Echinicola vietnamensis DSM 17526]